jgi:hypothetical protein
VNTDRILEMLCFLHLYQRIVRHFVAAGAESIRAGGMHGGIESQHGANPENDAYDQQAQNGAGG